MANEIVRHAAKSAQVKFWEIADAMQISEATMSRKLRHELPEAEQQRILQLIEKIATEREV